MGKILGDSLMPLDHIPPMFGRVEILYQKKQWQISLNSIMSAAKLLSQYYLLGEDNIQYATENGLPGWATINMRGSYRLLKNNALGLNAGIDNILDRNYRTFASGISGAGRNFWFSLTYDFN
jgi:hemoglobin/transferrin/lactoferrin receptor protein